MFEQYFQDYRMLILVAAIILVAVIMLIGINFRKKEPKRLICFNCNSKKFAEVTEDEYLSEFSDWNVLGECEEEDFMNFITWIHTERYFPSTAHQAKNVYDIYFSEN